MPKLLLILLTAMLLGCVGAPVPPTTDESLIVFVVPSMTSNTGQYQPTYGAAPTVSLHDVSGERRVIVGVLGIGKKIGYRVRPGRHEFMLASRFSTDFLEANVAPGKTYYVVLQLQAETSYHQQYGFRPVRPEDFENGRFNRWDSNTSFVRQTGKMRLWNEDNAEALEKRLQENRPAWDKQDSSERRLRTLQVSDGR